VEPGKPFSAINQVKGILMDRKISELYESWSGNGNYSGIVESIVIEEGVFPGLEHELLPARQRLGFTAKKLPALSSRSILKLRVDVTSYEDASERIIQWAAARESGYVSACSVHGAIESFDDENYLRVINGSRLNTPDGMPLVWALRLFGEKCADRVYGPNLMLKVCEKAAAAGVSIALYGGTRESLNDLQKNLLGKFPRLSIACVISPPFRLLTEQEDWAYTRQLRESGAGIIFVGIGCPRQDYWMKEHEHLFDAIQVGVGAAFDFHAGRTKQAPTWLQPLGLEWLFRVIMEPKRLWKRYIRIVPRFAVLFPLQYAGWLLK
jgi:N-acetylglucosaminyldiphosphoundecaprenol N-acetyl-beta-D-mannosaminyltransferase